ncbi:MAG: MFS transporter [Terriglobales bacterium]
MADRRADNEQNNPRNLYAFGLTSFFNDTASEMAYWVLPAFLASIGAGPAQLGVIEGIAESVASLAKLFSGYLADRWSRRKPLVVSGYVVANAVKPLLALVTSWWQVLGIRFVDRFAKGVRGTARDVMVAESVTGDRMGSAYGLIQAMDSAGAIAGPLLALWILARGGGMRSVFWTAAIPGSLCVLVALLGIRETARASSHRNSSSRAELRDEHRDLSSSSPVTAALPSVSTRTHLSRGFYYVLLVVTLFSLGNSSDMFLVLRAESVGIPVSLAPLLGLVFNLTYTLAAWPAGRLSDRMSRRKVAALGYLVFGLVYFAFAMGTSRTLIWAAMAFYGLFYALTAPVLKALVVETVAPEVRGRALGVYFSVTSVAALLASVITGELWKLYGPLLPFCLSAGAAVVSAALLLSWRSAVNSRS